MNIAIIGTSKLLFPDENEKAKITIDCILTQKCCLEDTIISGAALGIDMMAVSMAKEYLYKTKEFPPKLNSWVGYRERNLQIAMACDKLYCITIPARSKESRCYHHGNKLMNHEKTAACWTMNQAEKFGKECELIVL